MYVKERKKGKKCELQSLDRVISSCAFRSMYYKLFGKSKGTCTWICWQKVYIVFMKRRNKQVTPWLDRFYMKVIILATCSFKKSVNELTDQLNMMLRVIDL